jgi:hypothetical protein
MLITWFVDVWVGIFSNIPSPRLCPDMIVYMRPRWSRQLRARKTQQLSKRKKALEAQTNRGNCLLPNHKDAGGLESSSIEGAEHEREFTMRTARSAAARVGEDSGDKVVKAPGPFEKKNKSVQGDLLGRKQLDEEEAKVEEGAESDKDRDRATHEPMSNNIVPVSTNCDGDLMASSPATNSPADEEGMIMTMVNFYDLDMDPSVAIAVSDRFLGNFSQSFLDTEERSGGREC